MSKATWQDSPTYRRLLAKLKKDGVGGGIPGFRAATEEELTAVREGPSPSGLLAENGRTFLTVGEKPGYDDTIMVSELQSGAIRPGQTGRTQMESTSELDDPGLDSEYRYADSTVEAFAAIAGRGGTRAYFSGAMDDQIAYGAATVASGLDASGSMNANATMSTRVAQDGQSARVQAQAGRVQAALEARSESSVNTATLTLDGDICAINLSSANAAIQIEADAAGAFLDLNFPGSAVYLKSPNGTRYKLTVANNGTLSITPA